MRGKDPNSQIRGHAQTVGGVWAVAPLPYMCNATVAFIFYKKWDEGGKKKIV